MNLSSKNVKEQVIKMGTEYLLGGSTSALFFHEVPVPEILTKMVQKTSSENHTKR